MTDLICWPRPWLNGGASNTLALPSNQRRRRPRKAGRVRAFILTMTPHPESRPRPHGPLVPVPLTRRPLTAPARFRRPLDTAPLKILRAVLAGLHRLEVTA